MQKSWSLPAIGSPSGVLAQIIASSTPSSPLAKSVGESEYNQSRGPSPKRIRKFNQKQFYSTPFDVAYEDLAKARNLYKLEALFVEADADGSGAMSLDEFRDALRMPRIQRAFAALGVQPHQSELVFKSLDKRKTGELSITEFMTGLTELVGTDYEGTGKELDIETLRPAFRSKMKNQSVCELGRATGQAVRPSKSGHLIDARASSLDLGPVHLLPKVKVQRAFVSSASAQALHAATAQRHPLKLIFPF